ncbi:hypothetical protein [Aliarcobacter butzleri]|uniref:hypothetical protein n=1 Tax=Aliarcobacter butzleri TaxID=28197 RepID=UPI0021B1B454|nr:hypothetical protein [Aliarcobacter butzleri]MCT7573530.1 hypothetical protein [Aliarcobacter butzleri]MCT7592076.1 hypothetical protein [Aliarcobacter butzleri]
MILQKDNTKWLFLCAIHYEERNKERHLFDLCFALFTLLSKNIPISNISVLIDTEINFQINPFIQEILSKFQIFDEKLLSKLVSETEQKNIILTVIGHGSEDGIGTLKSIKPFDLINQINSNKKILTATVILGQCFAGIFNYINTNKLNNVEYGKEESSICFIGASHLNQSLSGKIDIKIGINEYSWVANIFLFNFFYWVLFPNDIDGDSKCTLIDAFKYSGIKTSQKLIQMKKEMFQITSRLNIDLYNLEKEIKLLKEQIQKIERETNSKESSLLTISDRRDLEKKELEYSSIIEFSEVIIELSYTNQDPWILNIMAARHIEFYLGK